MMESSTRRSVLALGLALAAGKGAAQAAYPSRPIRFLVGFAPGSATDTIARVIANHVANRLGQTVLVENRPGANGMLAAAEVVKAAADGHTVYFTSSSTITVNPLLYKKMPYDPTKDFQPVTLVLSAPFILVINPDKNLGAPVSNLADLVRIAKSTTGGLTYGSAGLGNLTHFTMELLSREAGLKLVHVPYKAATQAQAALLAKEIDMEFDTPGVLPQVTAGKLKALAVSTAQRWRDLPDVPTVSESGYPGFETAFWLGALMPAGTPPSIVKTMHDAIASAGDDAAARTALMRQGNLHMLNPEQFAARIKKELVINAEINRRANVQLD